MEEALAFKWGVSSPFLMPDKCAICRLCDFRKSICHLSNDNLILCSFERLSNCQLITAAININDSAPRAIRLTDHVHEQWKSIKNTLHLTLLIFIYIYDIYFILMPCFTDRFDCDADCRLSGSSNCLLVTATTLQLLYYASSFRISLGNSQLY